MCQTIPRLTAGALLLSAAFACSSDSVTDLSAPPALALNINPAVDTIFLTDSAGLTARVQLSLSATSFNVPVATPSGVEWTSDDPKVAVVDSLGGVHPAGVGTTTVTARVNSAKAHATIVVLYRVAKVVVSPSTLNVLAGDTLQIAAAAQDADGVIVPGTVYSFTTPDPTVVSVTRTGNTTARALFLKSGQARIDVTADEVLGSATGTVQPKQFISSPATGAPTGALVMAAGEDATCGLLPFGRGYCFGRQGLIGVAKDTSCFNDTPGGTEACTLVPLRIAGSLNLTSVSVGDSAACGTTADTHIYCWGSQKYGQLGNGVSATGTSVTPTLALGPSGTSFTMVTAGGNHACALDVSGKAYCWGQDSAYQLGNGERFPVNSTTPIPVIGGIAFASISAGRRHTCALTSDGTAYCWGSNAAGQLGTANVGDTLDTPTAVSGGNKFATISAGAFHTCGVTTAGSALCWGSNGSGQLGTGGTGTNTPTAVQGGATFKSISAGAANTCAVTTAGVVYCWGSNAYGQIGSGTLNPGAMTTPTAVQPVTGVSFTAVTVGTRHVCAVGPNAAYCWGSNVFGALGNELQAMKQPTPQKIATPQF